MIHLVNNLLKYDAIFSTCEYSVASVAAVELDDRLAWHCVSGSSPILRCSYYTFSYIIFQTLEREILLCCVAPFSLPLCDRLGGGELPLELHVAQLGLANSKAHLIMKLAFTPPPPSSSSSSSNKLTFLLLLLTRTRVRWKGRAAEKVRLLFLLHGY